MAKKCPECGISLKNNPKFCPGCGFLTSPAKTDPAAVRKGDKKDSAQRMFYLPEKQYGDTVEYVHHDDSRDGNVKEAAASWKTGASLYLSIAAVALSLTAIVMVVFFSILPSATQAPAESAAAETQAPTAAPTMPPTEPPISGIYAVSQIQGDTSGLRSLMFKNSVLELHSDYSGALTVGSLELCKVSLDRETGSADFMNTDCSFTFDGTMLVINYNGMTLVYRKE